MGSQKSQDARFALRQKIAESAVATGNRKQVARDFEVPIERVDRAVRENVYPVIAMLIQTNDPIPDVARKTNRNTSAVWRIYEQCIRFGIPVQERAT